ncbi:hypothetical protein JQ590_26835 [Bradyrhizobium diazoefficiens]|nr:hypothetical protein [Bradyrhizobium diazoefficiens]MBR0771883.1 hypothetical protein [Bradyrhizobium diazoefficiens]
MPKVKKDEEGARKWFADEKGKYLALLKQSHLVGNAVGNRQTDPLRVIASWLYMRICVTATSLSQLLEPQPTDYGSMRYLDHASISVVSRALIENAAVLLYACDHTLSPDEWECRRALIDVHDFVNRSQFLPKLAPDTKDDFPPDHLQELKDRLAGNAFFKTLPPKRQSALLAGADMFLNGRHDAMLALGWGDDATRGIYKYLSNQAHTLAMAFHRTASNELYRNDSAGARVTGAFALSFARRALGASCLHMIALFPDIELRFTELVMTALRIEYRTVDP